MPAMRTTVRIDDHLFRQLKERAARSGRTIASIIEDALRESFHRSEVRMERVKPLPVYGSQGLMPGVDLDSNAALLEVMEDS